MKSENVKTPKGKIEIEDKKVVTPKFRLSYPALFQPKSYNNQEAKYSITMIFDKETDLAEMEQAAHNAAVEKWGADKKQWPSKKVKSKKTPGKIINKCLVAMPFRDGDLDRPDKEEYEGTIFCSATSKKAPGLCDAKLKPIVNESGIKAGDYARAELIAFAYENSGNYGVAFSLMNVQKLETGESLGGRRDAASAFDAYESDDDDGEDNDYDSDDSDDSSDDEE